MYQHPGQIVVTGWSMDGRFLSFFSRDLAGGILYALPLTGDGERKPIEMFRIVLAVHPTPTLLQMTVFNRRGTVVSKVGEPGRYVNPALSPDGTKVAVIRTDPRTSIQDVWTYDVASGQGAAVTNDPTPENAPIWAPDGRHVAYASTRRGFAGIYRKAWDGTGQEEQLFQRPPKTSLRPSGRA